MQICSHPSGGRRNARGSPVFLRRRGKSAPRRGSGFPGRAQISEKTIFGPRRGIPFLPAQSLPKILGRKNAGPGRRALRLRSPALAARPPAAQPMYAAET